MGLTLTEPSAHESWMDAEAPEILVVDDDSGVRQILAALLSRQGFQVHLASNGKAALDVYRRHQSTIRGVLLDVNMPDIGCSVPCANCGISPW